MTIEGIFLKIQQLRQQINQNPTIPVDTKNQISEYLLKIENEISYLL